MWMTTLENQGKIRDQSSISNKVAKRVSSRDNQCPQHFSRFLQSQDSQVLPKRITFWANIMTSPKRTNSKLVNNSSLKNTRATIPNRKVSLLIRQVNHLIIKLLTQISRLLSRNWIHSSSILKTHSEVKICTIVKPTLEIKVALLAHIRKARVNKVWWGRSRRITIGMVRQMWFRISGYTWVQHLQTRRTLIKHQSLLIRAQWISWVHRNNKVMKSISVIHPNLLLNSHRWAEVEHLCISPIQQGLVKVNLANSHNSRTLFTHFNKPMVTTAWIAVAFKDPENILLPM